MVEMFQYTSIVPSPFGLSISPKREEFIAFENVKMVENGRRELRSAEKL